MATIELHPDLKQIADAIVRYECEDLRRQLQLLKEGTPALSNVVPFKYNRT